MSFMAVIEIATVVLAAGAAVAAHILANQLEGMREVRDAAEGR